MIVNRAVLTSKPQRTFEKKKCTFEISPSSARVKIVNTLGAKFLWIFMLCNLIRNFKFNRCILPCSTIFDQILMGMEASLFNCLLIVWMARSNAIHRIKEMPELMVYKSLSVCAPGL